MYQRIVCFKFKEDAAEQAIQQHMDSFQVLKQHIPQIVSHTGGRSVVAGEDKPPEFDSMHYLTFASLADIEIYFHHKAHQDFIQKNKTIWDNVLVLNASVDT